MNGPIAQLVALICHGNAALRGVSLVPFFPDNTTCEGCESIRFYEQKTSLFGVIKEKTVASLPDLWFSEIHSRGVMRLKLSPSPGPDPGISGLLSMAAIASSNGWSIEAVLKNGKSEFWQPRWKALSLNAPEKREWKVTYTQTLRKKSVIKTDRTFGEINHDFQKHLLDIRSFAEKFDHCVLFTVCFTKALRALNDPLFDVGHYRDLAPENILPREADTLLKAVMSAWVFGGADSWNTLKFTGEERIAHSRLSEELLSIMNEAIVAAASSSMPAQN